MIRSAGFKANAKFGIPKTNEQIIFSDDQYGPRLRQSELDTFP